MKINRLVFFKGFLLLSFRVIAQTTLVIQPGPEGKDAYLNDYYTYNIGDYTNMFAMAGTSGGYPFTSRSIFQFDLSAIPAGAEIMEANLSLYFANNPANPHTHYGENATYLQRVIQPWDEHTVTWWNQPQTTTQNQVRLKESIFPTQDYENIDVKALIEDMLADPENSYGMLMRLETEIMYRRIMFASSDYADPALRPKLVIVYKECELPEVTFGHTIQDQTVFFEAICPTAQTWLWDFGDGYLSTLENPFHEYEFQGTYEVCLHVEDSCGVADYCEEIEVCQYPVSGFGYGNEYLTIYFTDTSEHDQACLWSFGDGYYSDLENPWHSYDTAGYYEVCLQTYNDCGSDTLCQQVYVCGPEPDAWFGYAAEELTVNFQDQSQNATGFLWNFGDDQYSEEASPIHIYDTSGYYSVCFHSWNDCGADSVCQLIYVELSGIDEFDRAGFKLYPNPAGEMINITGNFDGIENIFLKDLSGRTVLKYYKGTDFKDRVSIPAGSLSPGVYILRMEGDKGVFSKKLIKV
jgi:PKD repeat protein